MKRISIAIGLFLCFASSLQAQPKPNAQWDTLVQRAIKAFNVPGVAVAVVKDGQPVLSKGYGIGSIKTKAPVDANTLFGIASNSKAFTAAALGILVDEGKLQWDDKVKEYLPEFSLYDPYVTDQFTIRDMLTHRSGLSVNAGDLMRTPDSTDFTLHEIIYNLRFLKPVSSFRSQYSYDNIFYLVAGELIARVSGMSWLDFIEQRILKPTRMMNSGASYKRVKTKANIIDGHREVNGRLETILRTDAEMDIGAGGIYSSAADMSQWMLMQLDSGKSDPTSKPLFSESVQKEMWTPQVIIPASKNGVYNVHFGAYGFGWFLTDIRGYKQVFHTGQDDGMISEMLLIPELRFGVTVLSNQEGGGAVRAIIDQLVDHYLGITGTDRVTEWTTKLKARAQSEDQALAKSWEEATHNQSAQSIKTDYAVYAGLYRDPWFGDVQISVKKNQLWFHSKRSPQLRGFMYPYRGNTYLVRWVNPQIKADAFVSFDLDENGNPIHMTMKRASSSVPVSCDFQDLDFHPVTKK